MTIFAINVRLRHVSWNWSTISDYHHFNSSTLRCCWGTY